MRRSFLYCGVAALGLAAASTVPLVAQSQEQGEQPVRVPIDAPRGGQPTTRPADRFFGGPGGFGGPARREPRKIRKQFDADKNGYLDKQERAAAREFLKKNPTTRPGFGGGFGGFGRGGPSGPGQGRGPTPDGPPGPDGRDNAAPPGDGAPGRESGFRPRGGFGGPGGPGGPGGFGRNREPARPGPKVSSDEVKNYPDSPLYEPAVLRTLFFEIDSEDFEAELLDFRGTDVEVPAKLIVDGKACDNVGLRFRGASSLMMIPQGYKKSLNVSIDYVSDDQRLYGYKTLNLLNSNDDPSFLHAVLYMQIARNYIPAPRANLVKVVINGESWGIYPSVQQFNTELIKEHFDTIKGARWKVPGSPRGGGGLTYLGDDIESYKQRYQIKSKDRKEDWEALVELCRVIDQTPIEQLHTKLEPILNLEGTLWFLALENAFINSDGYWIRDSDYSIYRDEQGRFHLIPHDANETFKPGGGPGFGRPRGGFAARPADAGAPPQNRDRPAAAPDAPPGPPDGGGPRFFGGPGPAGSGLEIDPLIALDDDRKPLRSRLLKNPVLRERYLRNVRTLATEWLDWNRLGTVAKQYHDLIDEEVAADTRKLASLGSFQASIEPQPQAGQQEQPEEQSFRRGREISLKEFAEKRREFLLNHEAIRSLGD